MKNQLLLQEIFEIKSSSTENLKNVVKRYETTSDSEKSIEVNRKVEGESRDQEIVQNEDPGGVSVIRRDPATPSSDSPTEESKSFKPPTSFGIPPIAPPPPPPGSSKIQVRLTFC